ncbi:hypothetical protein [Flammeovirga sp. EKP202]|uniref:hypothetical protein n=1 Tax=Flammeovirga sp. EKP202 TaxID=2770592 RepID=UPI00165F33BF|nr:hypothetical protein [Flammeovirga sp. EKP202]MBD0402925.1 hypothetical protein [Flammeovirga sp. EKP202]
MTKETIQKANNTRRANTLKRYQHIQNRFTEIYNSSPKGLRFSMDSVIDQLSDEFACAVSTIRTALKTVDN